MFSFYLNGIIWIPNPIMLNGEVTSSFPHPPPKQLKETESMKTTVFEAQIQINIFFNKLESIDMQKSIIEGLKLKEKIISKNLPTFQEFKIIYSGVIERYKGYHDKQKKSWSQQDVIVLLWIIDKYCLLNDKFPNQFCNIDWTAISRMIPFRTSQTCMFKFLSLQTNKLQDFPWQSESQQYLYKIANYSQPKDWVEISQELYNRFPHVYRSPKQCRQHWTLYQNLIDRKDKNFWTIEEDTILLTFYQRFGKKWKKISEELKGRSQNAIKNRFSLLVQKFYSKEDERYIDVEYILEERKKQGKRKRRKKNRIIKN